MRLLLVSVLCAGWVGCSGKEPRRLAAKAESGAADAGARAHVTLSTEVMRDAGIEVAAATQEALPQLLAVPGQIAANPDRLARISTPAPGRIERVLVEEGQHVRKGDPLFVVRVPDLDKLRAGERALAARARAARTNAERLQSLVRDRLAAQQAYLDADAQARALELEAESLRQQLRAIGASDAGSPSLLTLRAAFTGEVVMRSAVVGQPATVDQTLGTIASLSEVWFLARIYESDLGRARTGATADVTLNAFPERHFTGSVEYLGAELDPVTRAVNARIRVPNPDGALRVGLFGEAHIRCATADEPARVVVPESAVVDVTGKHLVFVQLRPGEFEPRAVVLGRLVYPRQAIESGLRAGEVVAVRGVFTLKAAWLRSTIEED
ncbi:MAG: Cobalt/zinc/cadmium efflux transporter, rane fusion protein, CzcB family [bacterium]|nr:Cobalt/zinc/cadmium efflux transporter, rane fusion protein, CzcB family [bacterium]